MNQSKIIEAKQEAVGWNLLLRLGGGVTTLAGAALLYLFQRAMAAPAQAPAKNAVAPKEPEAPNADEPSRKKLKKAS